jgi:hypothetical protein
VVENTIGIKRSLDPLGEPRKCRRLRLENLDALAHVILGPEKRGMAIFNALAYDIGIGLVAAWHSEPDEATGPVIEILGIKLL